MEKPVEFSKFYRLLNAAKEGEEGKSMELKAILKEYEDSNKSESPLHQLGESFLYIGVEELFKYTGTDDIYQIGQIDKETWEEMGTEKKGELPPHLANTMIKYAKKNNLSKEISKKWDIPKRQIDRNIMQMARYITEGIIDALE